MWLGDELTQISLTSIKLFFEESTWLEILQIIVGIPFVLFFLFLMFVGGPLDSIQKFLSARDIKKKN